MNPKIVRSTLLACIFFAGLAFGVLVFFPWPDISERGLLQASARISPLGGDLDWSSPREAGFPNIGARYDAINLNFGVADLHFNDVLFDAKPVASLLLGGAVVRFEYKGGSIDLPGSKSLALENGRVCMMAKGSEILLKDIIIRGDVVAEGRVMFSLDDVNIREADLLFSIPETFMPLVEMAARNVGELDRENDGWRLKTK